MDSSIQDANNLKAAVLATSLANKKFNLNEESSYIQVKKNLEAQLKISENRLVQEPIAFYKEGDNINPAGYVIETEKGVILSYHGTQFEKIFGSGGKELLHDMQMYKAKMKFGDSELPVHAGFKKEYESSKKSMLDALNKTDRSKKISISGHSLGGAVGILAAFDIQSNNNHFGSREIENVITFGGPRVLSKAAAKEYNKLGLKEKTLRVKQKYDFIPKLPPKILYSHVGYKLNLDADTSLSIHSGKVYRKIVDKITTEISNTKNVLVSSLRMSYEPKTIEDYIRPILKLTQEKLKNLLQASLTSTKKITPLFYKRKERKNTTKNNEKRNYRY